MVIGTVNDIVFKSQYAGLTNPAIIVVGEVVGLAPAHRAQCAALLLNGPAFAKATAGKGFVNASSTQ
jgi:siroheme synthase